MMSLDLENIQRWMQSIITHPAGVDAGLVAARAQAYLPLEPSDVEQIINRSSRMTSNERLAVYAKAYYARLIECLIIDFPIFHQTVGDDAFAGFAIDYLQHYPSQSYTLGQLGARFADYLADTRPAPSSAEVVQFSDWADFLVDLARLERTLSEVFDGPGVEQQPIISADELSAIDPQRRPEMRLTLAPCVQLLAPRFPLNDFYTAMKNGESIPPPPAKKSWLAITRRDYIVRRYELTEPQFMLLSALAAGQTLGEAISQAAAIYPGQLDQLAFELRCWFQTWTAAPMFEKATSA